MLSDHGMKPIYWTFHANRWLEEAGHLRYRRRSLQRLKGGALDCTSKVDQRLARTTRGYAAPSTSSRASRDPGRDRAFADIDFGSTRAYCFATGGQIFLGEASGARRDPALRATARRRPRRGPPPRHRRAGLRRLRKEELYHGAHLDKAPELVILPRDERHPRRLVASAVDGRLRPARARSTRSTSTGTRDTTA